MPSAAISTLPGAHHPEKPSPAGDAFADSDSLRTTFAVAMSAMYKKEVPLYGDLVRIVQTVNEETLRASALPGKPSDYDSPQRLSLERHGAIRLGTARELSTVRRIFSLMGMHSVGYYDLSVAGLPMHATCFRPISTTALEANPFRVFTTLLRPELLNSSEARDLALRLLQQRRIFSDRLLDLLDTAEIQQQGRLTSDQSEDFVTEVIKTFGWQPVAAATNDEYNLLRAEHPILADIACFRSAHINHLTPRTLDIQKAQLAMTLEHINVKSRIEGPPPRNCPILLRQTSFLALEEAIQFPTASPPTTPSARLVDGHHKARFGEIEERGAAVTEKGRKLYDTLLDEASRKSSASGESEWEETLSSSFSRYPDDWNELRRQRLVYCEYRCERDAKNRLAFLDVPREVDLAYLDTLVREKVLCARPITYEDFLPFSAAGIFRSNLQSSDKGQTVCVADEQDVPGGDQEGFELAMGCPVRNADQLYAEAERDSLRKCAEQLGLENICFE